MYGQAHYWILEEKGVKWELDAMGPAPKFDADHGPVRPALCRPLVWAGQPYIHHMHLKVQMTPFFMTAVLSISLIIGPLQLL